MLELAKTIVFFMLLDFAHLLSSLVLEPINSISNFFIGGKKVKLFYNGKLCWITGASNGIGKAIALNLASKGANLILSARNIVKLKEVADECKCKYPSCKAYVLEMDMEGLNIEAGKLEEILKDLGIEHQGIDVLINNAGISSRSTAMSTDKAIAKKLMVRAFFDII